MPHGVVPPQLRPDLGFDIGSEALFLSRLKSREAECSGSPSPWFPTCLWASHIPVHPSLLSTRPHGGDHHGPPKEERCRVWIPGSPAWAEWSRAFSVSFIWDTPQTGGKLGGVRCSPPPVLACDEKLPPSTWRGRDLRRLGISRLPPFPGPPLPEGGRYKTWGVDGARLSSLQPGCVCETGLFPEHWSEL